MVLKRRKAQTPLEYVILIGGIVILASATYFLTKGLLSGGRAGSELRMDTGMAVMGVDAYNLGREKIKFGNLKWYRTASPYRVGVAIGNNNAAYRKARIALNRTKLESAGVDFSSMVLAYMDSDGKWHVLEHSVGAETVVFTTPLLPPNPDPPNPPIDFFYIHAYYEDDPPTTTFASDVTVNATVEEVFDESNNSLGAGALGDINVTYLASEEKPDQSEPEISEVLVNTQPYAGEMFTMSFFVNGTGSKASEVYYRYTYCSYPFDPAQCSTGDWTPADGFRYSTLHGLVSDGSPVKGNYEDPSAGNITWIQIHCQPPTQGNYTIEIFAVDEYFNNQTANGSFFAQPKRTTPTMRVGVFKYLPPTALYVVYVRAYENFFTKFLTKYTDIAWIFPEGGEQYIKGVAVVQVQSNNTTGGFSYGYVETPKTIPELMNWAGSIDTWMYLLDRENINETLNATSNGTYTDFIENYTYYLDPSQTEVIAGKLVYVIRPTMYNHSDNNTTVAPQEAWLCMWDDGANQKMFVTPIGALQGNQTWATCLEFAEYLIWNQFENISVNVTDAYLTARQIMLETQGHLSRSKFNHLPGLAEGMVIVNLSATGNPFNAGSLVSNWTGGGFSVFGDNMTEVIAAMVQIPLTGIEENESARIPCPPDQLNATYMEETLGGETYKMCYMHRRGDLFGNETGLNESMIPPFVTFTANTSREGHWLIRYSENRIGYDLWVDYYNRDLLDWGKKLIRDMELLGDDLGFNTTAIS